jgi:uncharacterized protein YbjQ (UPF0145 family)
MNRIESKLEVTFSMIFSSHFCQLKPSCLPRYCVLGYDWVVGEELPASAEARVAGIRASGTWGSALTSGEFAAIRSVGFEPVGQVFGAAVFGVAYGDGYSCPRTSASSAEAVQVEPSGQRAERDDRGAERDEEGPLGPLVRAMDQARLTAVERLTAECAELGGDGVVGLRVSRGSYLLGGQEFTAVGTAVRARGAESTTFSETVRARSAVSSPARRAERVAATGAGGQAESVTATGEPAPFTSDLSGQDFAKLIMAGWMPAGLVLGVAIGACHDDWQTTRQTRRWSGNREVVGWTDVVNQSRRDARDRLGRDIQRLGAEGAVIAKMQLRVTVRDCPAQPGRRDHIVEASILGTAVARFARSDQALHADQGPQAGQRPGAHQDQDAASPALAVLPLASQDRQSRDIGRTHRL